MGYPALELSSKTAVVIGGTSGIGLTIAKGLAQAGANVAPTGRRAELVKSAAADIQKAGGKSLAMSSDVTHRASLEELLRAVVGEFGAVDILVNCAGTTKRTPTLDVTESEWNHIIETNLNGTLRACQIFGRHMIDRKYGRIINIASLSSFVALFEVAAYGASKVRSCVVDEITRNRMGPPRCVRQRHRARRAANRPECGSTRWHCARKGIPDAHSYGPIWKTRRTCRCGCILGVGGGQLRHRPPAGSGWRNYGQRGEPINLPSSIEVRLPRWHLS